MKSCFFSFLKFFGKKTILVFFVLFIFSILFFNENTKASTPPRISNVEIVDVDNNSALIKWETDRPSDSLINYGLDRNYGQARDPLADKTEHQILLDNLFSGTTYHLRVISRDEDGNQAVSSDFTFTTTGYSQTVDSGMGPAEVAENIIKEIESVDEIKKIRDALSERVLDISDDLSIIAVPDVFVTENSATVVWETNRPASSRVEFEASSNFDIENPFFSRSQNDDGFESTEHEVEVVGLSPATKYHFQVVSEDSLSVKVRGPIGQFTTDALSPAIRNVEISSVGEDFAVFEWSTSVPAESLIEYENLDTGEIASRGSPTLSTVHTVRLADLDFGVSYMARIIAISDGGGVDESSPIEFKTEIDENPPVISNVSTESTLYPGAESRVQTIVSWRTNKLTVCRFNYQEGLAAGADQFDLDPRDSSFLTNHVQVVVSFRPATVYQFWFVCEDRFGNEGVSEKFVVFTPQQEKNIIDIILENFEESFGWVENILN